MSDKHLEKVLVTINYTEFVHCLGRINAESNLGLHTGNRQHFINIQKIAREASRSVDTVKNDIQEEITA